jgi:serine/threonine protein kinase/tetratricopeptide (TPR) repeat protein
MRERDIFDAALAIADPAKRSAYLAEASAGNEKLRNHIEGLLAKVAELGSFLEMPGKPGGQPPPGVMAIFDKALDIALPTERQAYLDKVCAGRPEIRQQVEALLAAYEKSGGSRELLPSGHAATLDAPLLEGPGTIIGPYKLQEEIGHGGFGVVFMAEQKEPIRRKVALKVLKPGMDTKEVVARFEAERQALALMDHANIAKVFDAGQTTTGRPYFVMDLVKGVPITKFCDEAQLSPKERLKLFIDVCRAVQHSHQKGIIHRDIKPSNVLVTMQDGAPLVKVIDFGIAKALGQQLTDKSLFTGFAQMVGTPVYMSPEQAGLSNVDVDTRSDIYSLGVLLYELLTGTTPLDKKRLRDAAYDEIRRLIREEDPPKPSTRLSTLGPEASVVSAQRKSDPQRLSRLFRGDLDWIVMKALDKDRSRRFENATGLVEDIERYLANEPVLAGPPTAGYRLRKFARRHRAGLLVGVVATVALLAVLTTVAGSIGWMAGERSAREKEIRRRVIDLVRLARGLAEDNQVAAARDKLKVAQNLIAYDRAALPALAAELDRLVDDVNGVNRFQDLIDQADAAETTSLGYSPQRGELLVKSLESYGVLERDDWYLPLESSSLGKQTVRQIKRSVYEELLWLANHAFAWWYDPRLPWRSDVIELGSRAREAYVGRHSELAARQALAYLGAAEKAYTPTHWFYRLRADCQHTLHKDAAAQKDLELASQTAPASVTDFYFRGLAAARKSQLTEAVQALEAGLRLEPAHFSSLMLRGYCLLELQDQQKAEAAVSTYGGCISQRPGNARAYFERGLAHKLLGRSADAEKDFAEAKKLNARFERTFVAQGDAYSELRQWDKAIAEYSKAIEATAGKQYLPERGLAHLSAGRLDEAIADYSAALKVGNRFALYALPFIYSRQRRLDQALPLFTDYVERNSKFAFGWEERGKLHAQLGRWDKALTDFNQAIALFGIGKGATSSAFNNRAVAYAHLGKANEAKADFYQAVVIDKGVNRLWATWSALDYYGRKDLGLFEMARAELSKGVAAQPRQALYANALAWILAAHADRELREPRRAVELAKKSVALEKKYWAHWLTLGLAHYRDGEYQAARKALEKSIELNQGLMTGGDGYQWFLLALVLAKLNHQDDARAAYGRGEEWMSSVPNNRSLSWPYNRGPDSDEIRRIRAEAAELLGMKEVDP